LAKICIGKHGEVFNILGKQVCTFVDEEKSAGSYSERFDGTNPASGVYFYRLQAGAYTETKKLLLLLTL
jgi:hypothetical protein